MLGETVVCAAISPTPPHAVIHTSAVLPITPAATVLATEILKNRCAIPWRVGVTVAQWWSSGLMVKRSLVRVWTGTAEDFSSPGSSFCADSYFGICSTPVLPQ